MTVSRKMPRLYADDTNLQWKGQDFAVRVQTDGDAEPLISLADHGGGLHVETLWAASEGSGNVVKVQGHCSTVAAKGWFAFTLLVENAKKPETWDYLKPSGV